MKRPASLRTLWIALALVAIAGVVAYMLQPHDAPVGERLRYRPPAEGEQLVADDPATSAALVHRGRTYVPAYSHAYVGSGTPVLFAITLSIRNADASRPLRLQHVEYHATGGDHVRSFLAEPRLLPPLGTVEYFVEQNDEAGGSGANFVVEWATEEHAPAPVIEAVMLGTSGASGFAFSMRGVDVPVP